jgi:hypothetical protein
LCCHRGSAALILQKLASRCASRHDNNPAAPARQIMVILVPANASLLCTFASTVSLLMTHSLQPLYAHGQQPTWSAPQCRCCRRHERRNRRRWHPPLTPRQQGSARQQLHIVAPDARAACACTPAHSACLSAPAKTADTP